MEKEELLLIHGTEYKEMTREILYAAGLEAQIGARDKKIGIKPQKMHHLLKKITF